MPDSVRNALAELPGWALATGALVVLVLAVLGFASSIWIGLSVLVIVGLVVVAYAAWMRLPGRYGEGPDEAERRQQERLREERKGG